MKLPGCYLPVICIFLLSFLLTSFSLNPKPRNVWDNDLSAKKVQASIREASKDLKKPSLEQRKVNIAAMQSRGLSNMKVRLEGRVQQAQMRVNGSKSLSDKEKDFKLHVLEMFLEEMKESERDMLDAEESLKKSLTMDFWNASTLKENSQKRLEALRLATLKEEKSFNRMHEFEMKMKKYMADMNSTSWMGEIIKEISHAADQLEDHVAEHEFVDREMEVDGAHIEAVVHVKEGLADSIEDVNKNYNKNSDNIDEAQEEKLDVLIDSQRNKYILTRLNDPTSPFIDHVLVMDIIMILLLSIPLGYICQLAGLPSLFGYILAGLVLGPSGLNCIQEMIQMETLGELGVFMIMFCTGLEFSVDKIRKVWRIAVQAPFYTTAVMMLIGIVIGSITDAPISECAFVSACLSLSSTPLVNRFLQGSSKDTGSTEYSSILLGMLVVQDIQLSFIIALMPGLAAGHTGESWSEVFLHSSFVIFETLLSLLFIVLVAALVTHFVMPFYARHIALQNRELQVLGSLALMYVCQIFTSLLGVSMELGCFMAGAMLSYANHQPAVEQKVFAIHDFLSVLFFASIGFHVFPTFVFVQLTLLVSLTALLVAGKYMICLFVLRLVLPSQARKLKWIVSSGLAQVSEFSFVLGSRARHLKIITREVYLLILSVTTLSLLLAPALWKLSLWRYRVRHVVGHIS